jgi:hypothetical protein
MFRPDGAMAIMAFKDKTKSGKPVYILSTAVACPPCTDEHRERARVIAEGHKDGRNAALTDPLLHPAQPGAGPDAHQAVRVLVACASLSVEARSRCRAQPSPAGQWRIRVCIFQPGRVVLAIGELDELRYLRGERVGALRR